MTIGECLHVHGSSKQKGKNVIPLNIMIHDRVFLFCFSRQDATITECSLAFTKLFPMIVTPALVCQRVKFRALTGRVGKRKHHPTGFVSELP